MTSEEVKKVLEQVKPMFVPPASSLELVELTDKEIKITVTGLPQDLFKVQGKVINSGDEIKKKIAARIESSCPGLQVIFVQ
jgi:hypothetical protein